LELHKYEYLFGDDFIDTLALRFDSDESGLCESRRRLIHPKRGQTVQNTWLTIVNDDNKYRQGVTIEECQ
jgi:Spaetzle